jgi:adenosylhomocysteine nucleosidase
MTPYVEPWNGSGRTSMSKTAIVAALEREIRPLVRNWARCERLHEGRQFRFFEQGDSIVVAGGIGASAARRAAEAVIALYAPETVYSVGFAGALDASLAVGDIVKPARVINAGDASIVRLSGGTGALVSFDSVANPAQKANLRDAFAAAAVDMEAAAVARAAEARGVVFGAIKAISDASDLALPPMDRFITPDGAFSEIRFAAYAAIRPWMWPQVLRLARNSNQASRALCAALSSLLNPHTSPLRDSAAI